LEKGGERRGGWVVAGRSTTPLLRTGDSEAVANLFRVEVSKLVAKLAKESIQPPRINVPTQSLSPEVIQSEMERRIAPVVAKNALLDMLDEARTTTQWVRRTFWFAAVTLLVSIASIAIVLLRG
jgi:hypothetical protein